MRNRCSLTSERANSLLVHDVESGELYWKVFGYRIQPRGLAGMLHSNGYVYIGIDGQRYAAHRVVWLMHHGKWPEHTIDHINGTKHDNTIGNLRDVTSAENCRNFRRGRAGRLLGASYHKRFKKWNATYTVNGKKQWLGTFETEAEAHQAYLAARAASPSSTQGG